jgi:hypothetical protein
MGSTISAIREIEKSYGSWENYLKETAPRCPAKPFEITAFKQPLKIRTKAYKRLILRLIMNEF